MRLERLHYILRGSRLTGIILNTFRPILDLITLGALNLDTGQSDVNPCHATRERTDTSERSPSLTSFLTGLEQLDLDGDQTTVSSGDEDDSNTSSLHSVRQEPLPEAPIYD